MNVPKTISDARLAEFLSDSFETRAALSFRCAACGKMRRSMSRVVFEQSARRGMLWFFLSSTIGPPTPGERRVSWCIRCCRTLRGIALADIVARRIRMSLYPDYPF